VTTQHYLALFTRSAVSSGPTVFARVVWISRGLVQVEGAMRLGCPTPTTVFHSFGKLMPDSIFLHQELDSSWPFLESQPYFQSGVRVSRCSRASSTSACMSIGKVD
jgi:hypothetical protein